MHNNISIIMPTYNCAAYIGDAIRSILNQTYKDFEFLIIDDGSTDETELMISKFKDSRIRHIKKCHTGFADSLNFGLQHANYDLIARMDSDDIALPLRIEKQLSIFIKRRDFHIIGSWYAVFHNKTIEYIVKTPENHQEIMKSLSLYSTIPHSGCMYNRNLIFKFGGYFGEAFEDYLLWLKLKNQAIFYNIPEVLTYVRFRHNSLSRDNLKKKHRMIYNIQEPYYVDVSKNFSIMSLEEINGVRGWREYFYGSPKLARKIWRVNWHYHIRDYRLIIAFLFSYSNRQFFNLFKELRIRFRLNYLIRYFRNENMELRKQFKLVSKQ